MQPSFTTYDTPPAPPSAGDVLRWNEGRLRRRLLSGTWGPDLEQRLRMHFGRTRRGILGPKSMAKNTFRRLCNELAASYIDAPQVRHAQAGEVPALLGRTGIATQLGMWPLLRRMQVQLIGLREMFVRVDWSAELGTPALRLVTPDVVTAGAWASAPAVPVEIRELRWRQLPDGRALWAWDWLSIADPANPFFRVVSCDLAGGDKEDITAAVFGRSLAGEAYPYRWTQGERAGTPFLPYVLYHASCREKLFDAFEGREVVEGSLDVSAAWTYTQHTLFRAAFPQRWALGAYVAGTAPVETASGPRSEVATDPSSLLHLEAASGVVSPQVGQWGPGADPEIIARTVEKLESAVADFDGLDNSHVIRSSSNPWSAAALSITREGKREAQRRYAGELRGSDLELVEKLACICNLEVFVPEWLPESDYLITYSLLPLSPQEAEERRKHAAEMIAQGRMSIVDAYLLEHPGMLRVEAEAELKRIQAENATFGVQAGTQPTPYAVAADAHKAEEKDSDKADGMPANASAAPASADAPATPAANTALNGAQVDAAKGIVSDVATGALPREAGVSMLVEFFNLSAQQAERIMGSVGKGFKPATPAMGA